MAYRQREVVKVEAKMPNGDVLTHPYIIISCSMANSYEKYYTGVMISATKYTDRFTFILADSMFEGPLEKTGCQVRTKLIISFSENDIRKLMTRMRLLPFKNLIEDIKGTVFSVDERD